MFNKYIPLLGIEINEKLNTWVFKMLLKLNSAKKNIIFIHFTIIAPKLNEAFYLYKEV